MIKQEGGHRGQKVQKCKSAKVQSAKVQSALMKKGIAHFYLSNPLAMTVRYEEKA